MSEVDRLMALVAEYGRIEHNVGRSWAISATRSAENAEIAALSKLTELRTLLTSEVPVWREITDEQHDGSYMWLSNGFNMRVGFWRNGPQFECNGSVGGGWADMLGAESMGRTDLHFLPTIYQRLPIIPTQPPPPQEETK